MKKQTNLGTHVVALRDREGVGKLRDLHMSASSLSLCNTADESDSSNLAETEYTITTNSKGAETKNHRFSPEESLCEACL